MEESKELKSEEVPFLVQTGKTITKIEFHEKLGVIFVGTSDRDIFVIDPTLGDILYTCPQLSQLDDGTEVDPDTSKNDWDFMLGREKIVVVHKNTLGIRGEYKGIILLGTILQTPIKNSSDPVQIELNVAEAESLCHSLTAIDASNDSKEVEKQLRSCVTKDDGTSFVASVKRDKWSTVKLELPYSVLKSTFQSIVTELWKKNAYIPQLSIAASILERLNMLLPPGKGEDRPINKTQMFSESARLNTFSNWPHTEYKWALPENMARAGFYHNPAPSDEDRALCFACTICLASWEPTDEPWSEHQQHSPFCPFVRREHTHNVPLYLSYARAPATKLEATSRLSKWSQRFETPILGKSSFVNAFVVAYPTGLVVVWDFVKQKEALQFEVTYKDVESLGNSNYCDIDMKPKDYGLVDSDVMLTIPQYSEPTTNLGGAVASTISSVATLGVPSAIRDLKKPVPPSIVVGATIKKLTSIECAHFSPVILVYGVSANAISHEECEVIRTTEIFKAVDSTDTKEETQVDEVDLFVSYISESNMTSISVAFSEMNISDSSGTFTIDSMNADNNATIPPKKAESSTLSATSRVGKTIPNVLLHQKLSIPVDLQHCFVIRHLLPSLDGSQCIVVLECDPFNNCKEEESQNTFGAMLVYNVKQEANIVTLDEQPTLLRKIDDVNDLIVSLCLIPSDVDEPLIACVLRRGNVDILNLNELMVVHRISQQSPNSRITSVSYCTSIERLCCGTNTGVVELFSLKNQTKSESDSDKQV